MFTTSEINLMVLYNPGSRLGLLRELGQMQACLASDETKLRELTAGVIRKLQGMTDEQFAALDLTPRWLKGW